MKNDWNPKKHKLLIDYANADGTGLGEYAKELIYFMDTIKGDETSSEFIIAFTIELNRVLDYFEANASFETVVEYVPSRKVEHKQLIWHMEGGHGM